MGDNDAMKLLMPGPGTAWEALHRTRSQGSRNERGERRGQFYSWVRG